MKYITHFLLYSLCILAACQNRTAEKSAEIEELSENELIRIYGLIDPAPKTYQEAQINELIEYALEENWPVQKDPNGLVFWIIDPGNDTHPKKNNSIQVRYKGNLLDGTVFDQSPASGEPVSFSLSETILAWQHAIPKIGEGGRIKILAHSDLAYGSRQIGNVIPSYSPLIFKVELIAIKKE